MVFVWHFSWASGTLYAELPIPPFSLLTEGHTGVALFMTLSRYLFAKLLADKKNEFSSVHLESFFASCAIVDFNNGSLCSV
ncbi:MAG: peptidoglycan/LPS O-acetylase OafA/YrhL [Arenicella sp.]|jgi:peptidoglycan/LPS O-acetylase OafA/YrhL